MAMHGDWDAQLLILNGVRAGACYALGVEETVIDRCASVLWEDDGHVAVGMGRNPRLLINGEQVLRHRLAEEDEVQIGETLFAYRKRRTRAVRGGEKATLLRATTLLYLFREWEKSRGEGAQSLVETQLVSVIGA